MKAKYFSAIFGLAFCVLGAWVSGRAGLSRYLINEVNDDDEARNIAVALRLTPSDPEAHSARAFSLWRQGKFPEVVKEYERIVELRPRDYVAWSYLGDARDSAGDSMGALDAYLAAVKLAPYYAQTHWSLGEHLLSLGRVPEAFAELRRAADSEPAFTGDLIDLAFEMADGHAEVVLQAVKPSNDETRIALSHVLLDKSYPAEAVALFNTGEEISSAERQKFIAALLEAGYFEEAYQQWAKGGSGRAWDTEKNPKMFEPSFEGPVNLSEAGFGWQSSNKLTGVSISLDQNDPHSGAHSLRIDFAGNSDPSLPIIFQILLVEPNKAYRLTFAARSEDLLTGGPPQILVDDAQRLQAVGPELILPSGTREWSNYKVDFRTGAETHAIRVVLQRQGCTSSPCPAFGRLWLDDFAVRPL